MENAQVPTGGDTSQGLNVVKNMYSIRYIQKK